MSILSSTGAGMSSMIYIANINKLFNYYAHNLYGDIKFSNWDKDLKVIVTLKPMISVPHKWLKTNKEILGHEYPIEMSLSCDTIYKVFDEDNSYEAFTSRLVKGMSKTLKNLIKNELESRIPRIENISDSFSVKYYVLANVDNRASFITPDYNPSNKEEKDFI